MAIYAVWLCVFALAPGVLPRRGRKRKKGPGEGALLLGGEGGKSGRLDRPWEGPASTVGGLDAQGHSAGRGGEAEEQQEGRSDTVEETFELSERHDTHLSVFFGLRGSEGSFLTAFR